MCVGVGVGVRVKACVRVKTCVGVLACNRPQNIGDLMLVLSTFLNNEIKSDF